MLGSIEAHSAHMGLATPLVATSTDLNNAATNLGITLTNKQPPKNCMRSRFSRLIIADVKATVANRFHHDPGSPKKYSPD